MMAKAQKSAPLLGRIRVPKTYDALADILREHILEGAFVDGSPLPSERGIVQETGLSRGSVREALRVLEAEGLIHTKTGRYGGAIARRPDQNALSRPVSIFVRSRRVPLGALIDARMAIEPMLAFLAARNRTNEDVTALENACDDFAAAQTAVGDVLAERNVAWHSCVASASHNDLLIAFMASISNAMAHEDTTHTTEFRASREMRSNMLRAHRSITDAIVCRLPDVARRRMEKHLNAYAIQVASVANAEIDLD